MAAVAVLDILKLHLPTSNYLPVLENAIESLDDPATRLEAARALCSASHSRRLGDVFLEEVAGYEWPKLVGKLRGLSSRYMQENDPYAAIGREQGFNRNELEAKTKAQWPTQLFEPATNELDAVKRHWPRIRSFLRSNGVISIAKFVLLPLFVVLLSLLYIRWGIR